MSTSKWRALWFIAFFALLVFLRTRTPHHPAAPSLVAWVPIAEAQQRATSSSKPIFYKFSTEWCGPYGGLDDEVFHNEPLAARINLKLVPVHIVDRMREDGRNPEDVEALLQRFDVRAFPTMVVVDANGTTLARLEGFGGRDRFEEEMNRFLQ